MFTLIIVKQIAMIIFYLSLPIYLVYFIFEHFRENEKLSDKILNKLTERAINHEEPVMLNVSTDRLVEKVADEIERRQQVRRRFR